MDDGDGLWCASCPMFSPDRPVISDRRCRISRRRLFPGIFSSSGAARVARWALPSRVAGSASSISCWKKYSASGWACWVMRARKASSPSARTRLSGSSPSGRNRKRTRLPSCRFGSTDSRARQAALRPAWSPSKQNRMLGTRRNRRLMCSSLVAVPRVATALRMPCWARAMTSM